MVYIYTHNVIHIYMGCTLYLLMKKCGKPGKNHAVFTKATPWISCSLRSTSRHWLTREDCLGAQPCDSKFIRWLYMLNSLYHMLNMYIYIYIHLYIYIYLCVCMYVCTYVRMYVCTYVAMYLCTYYVRMYVRTYVCVCMYVCVYVYVCMYACIYVCMYVWIYKYICIYM